MLRPVVNRVEAFPVAAEKELLVFGVGHFVAVGFPVRPGVVDIRRVAIEKRLPVVV
jgi:hypothetical protein